MATTGVMDVTNKTLSETVSLPSFDLFSSTTRTTTASSDDDDMSDIAYIAYCIIGPFIIVVGVLGNMLTLVTLTKVTLWCNGMTYIYLKCLALTDAFALVSAIAMDVRLGLPRRKLVYWEAFYHAHVELPLLNFFMGCSIFIVLCLTKDRFLSVCFPTKYRETSNNNKARVSTALCYLVAFILNAPLAVLKEVRELPSARSPDETLEDVYYEAIENTAVTETTEWKIYVYISEGMVRILPIVVLTILNLAIIRQFRVLAEKRKQLHGSRSQKKAGAGSLNVNEERRMLALLSTIVVLFVVLNTPSAILSIIYTDALAKSRPFQIFRACANDLELANFAINFYAYFMCSTEFRNAFFNVICGRSTRAVAWFSEASRGRGDRRSTVAAVRFDVPSTKCDIEQNLVDAGNNEDTRSSGNDVQAVDPQEPEKNHLDVCEVDVHSTHHRQSE